jgi:hypothetical protein
MGARGEYGKSKKMVKRYCKEIGGCPKAKRRMTSMV